MQIVFLVVNFHEMSYFIGKIRKNINFSTDELTLAY